MKEHFNGKFQVKVKVVFLIWLLGARIGVGGVIVKDLSLAQKFLKVVIILKS